MNVSLRRVRAVAKKDFKEASQSRALWALVVVFVAITVISVYAFAEAPELFGGQADASFEGLLFFIAAATALFVPIAAIVACYKSLAGERELGSIKVLLSLPATRTDVFFGKVLGRAAVLVVAVAVGILVGLGFGAVLLGEFDPVGAAVFFVMTLVFVLVYTSIFVSLSAVTGSTARSTTYALGFFVIFEILWDVIPLGILYVIEGFQLPAQVPDWYVTVAMVAPATSYFSAVNALLPDVADDVAEEPDGVTAGGDLALDYADAFYASAEMGFFFLAFWLAVPLAVGYYRFNDADL